jgi:hypothetical protein
MRKNNNLTGVEWVAALIFAVILAGIIFLLHKFDMDIQPPYNTLIKNSVKQAIIEAKEGK